jgi:hypothetical protein
MKIKSINIIDGKNKWSESKDKLIHMVLDLGVYENKPSDKIEGFYERIKEYLPSLKSHRCSEGKPGGFFKRIKDGTWMGHIIEHVALELQTLAGMNTGWGRTRGVKGQKGVYNVVFNYENKDSGKLAAREAFNVVNDIINDIDPEIDKIVKKLKPKRNLQEHIIRILREETKIKPILNNMLNMLFDGFDDIYYDWAQYNCGMGICCDPYAVGFVLPTNNHDDYLFKLVDGNNYDDDGDYPKELRDELPEVCYEMPDVKNPNFNFIIFYEEFAEEIEDYLGHKKNWKFKLLEIINEKFGCKATNIMFI